jgi:hypothetical protein
MRKESDDGGSLLELALQFRNEREWFGVGVVQIEDDERGLLFAVLLHALGQVFVVLGELDFDVQLACGLLNLGGEEEVVDEGKDARGGIFAQCGQRFGIGGRERRSKARTSPATSALV